MDQNLVGQVSHFARSVLESLPPRSGSRSDRRPRRPRRSVHLPLPCAARRRRCRAFFPGVRKESHGYGRRRRSRGNEGREKSEGGFPISTRDGVLELGPLNAHVDCLGLGRFELGFGLQHVSPRRHAGSIPVPCEVQGLCVRADRRVEKPLLGIESLQLKVVLGKFRLYGQADPFEICRRCLRTGLAGSRRFGEPGRRGPAPTTHRRGANRGTPGPAM